MNVIALDKALLTLKQVFPNLSDEIILSALLQNENNYEATLDALLFFTSSENENQSREKQEKELSLFNQYSNPQFSYEMERNIPKESIRGGNNILPKNIASNNILPNNIPSNNKTPSSTNKNKQNFNKVSIPKQEPLEKKSFGQKFKCKKKY